MDELGAGIQGAVLIVGIAGSIFGLAFLVWGLPALAAQALSHKVSQKLAASEAEAAKTAG